MPLEFVDRWEADNTATPILSKDKISAKVTEALATYDGKDTEFQALKNRGTSAGGLATVKVTKGLHKGAGDDPLSEAYVTLEIPDWPRPKRFHLYFTYLNGGKGPPDWHASQLTYVDSSDDRAIKTWSIL